MKPIPFKQQTTIAAKNQPQYNPLPAHVDKTTDGIVTTCWKLTWFERLQVLFTGRVWMQLMMFRTRNRGDIGIGQLNPITPSKLFTSKPLLK